MTGTSLFGRFALRAAAVVLSLAGLASPALHAQATPLVTGPVDETHLTQLKGNVSPKLRGAKDLGAADVSQPSGRLLVVLKRSAAQEASLQSFLQGAHDKSSAGYHKWLAPGEFGKRFGAADSDIAQLTGWLQSHGLAVAKVSSGKTAVEFSGTVGQVNEAFHTTIHTYSANGETHHANATEPMIPAALSGLVAGVTQLNDFKPQPLVKAMGRSTYDPKTHTGTPQWTYPEGTGNPPLYLLAPEDVATQYDLAPATKAGIAGDGQTIGIINESNIDLSLVNAYRTLFGLPYNPPVVVIDGNDPGINGAATEAYLDVENAGSVAPNATVKLYIASSYGLLGDGGLTFSILRAVNDDEATVLSLSFGDPETDLGTANNALINSVWEQAAAQGQTVIVSTGDSGSSDGEFGLGVNGFASTPWDVGAGGSDIYLSDYATGGASLANYWSAKNDASNGSLTKAFPEQPWDGSQFGLNNITYDPAAGQPFDAVGGGGGASACAVGGVDPATYRPACVSGYPKPSWQVGAGVPNDSVRDLPDFSLFASNAINGVIWPICAEAGDCTETDPAVGSLYVTAVGGTSASAPTMAGIMALVNEKYGPQGQANFVLYPLAAQYPAVFHDLTLGSNNEPCYSYQVGYFVGCEADTNGDGYYSLQGYSATTGYDLASGLGTIDVGNLIADWGKVSFKPSATTLTLTPTTITHGETITATATVTGTGTPAGAVALVSGTTLPNNKGASAIQLGAGGTGQEAINYFPGGTYTVYGSYSGDGINGSSQSQPTTITVNPEATALTFTPQYFNGNTFAAAPITAGSTIPYGSDILIDVQIAGVSAPTGGTNGNATGTVTFTDGTTTLATAAVNAGSAAEFNASYLAVGNHSISASYSGDASFQPATAGPIAFTVGQSTTQSFFTFAPSPTYNSDGSIITIPQNQALNVTALFAPGSNVEGGLLPTGTATFQYGSNAPITAPVLPYQNLSIFGNWSAATFDLGGLPVGTGTLTMTYSGDANFSGVVDTEVINVVASTLSPSTTTFVTTPSDLSNIIPGTTITGVATVTGTGTAAPTGSIALTFGNFLQGSPFPLVAGTANSSTAAFSFRAADLPPGNNQFSVNYFGDNNYQSSSSSSVVALNDPSDFSVQAVTSAVTIASGSSGTATLSLTSFNGFAGAVTLGCAPAVGLTCSTGSSSSVALTANGTATATLTIGTVTSPYGTSKLTPSSGSGWGAAAAGPALALLVLCVLPRKRRNGKAFFSLVALAALSAGLGCGSSKVPISQPGNITYNAKPGTYTVLVTGTSAAGTIHNTAITVTVQ